MEVDQELAVKFEELSALEQEFEDAELEISKYMAHKSRQH